MKPGESKEVDVALQIHYKISAAGIGHFQAEAHCDFHGQRFEGKGSHPVGTIHGNPLIDCMATAFGSLLLSMQAEFDKFHMLPKGVMLKPEVEELRTHLLDLFELPQTEWPTFLERIDSLKSGAPRQSEIVDNRGGRSVQCEAKLDGRQCTMESGHRGAHYSPGLGGRGLFSEDEADGEDDGAPIVEVIDPRDRF